MTLWLRFRYRVEVRARRIAPFALRGLALTFYAWLVICLLIVVFGPEYLEYSGYMDRFN